MRDPIADPGLGPKPSSDDPPGRLLPARAARWRCFLVLAAVLLTALGIVLATYWPALSASATYMDDKAYLDAPAVRHPSWASMKTIFGEVLSPSTASGYYQPLSQLSLMLDFVDPKASSGLVPFHRTTLLLHLLNVALVAVLLYLLFGNWPAAALLSLLYGLHPLNADAVLWVAERKTVLSTAFALGSLLLYVVHVRHADQIRRREWKRYCASLLLYICAILAKPTAVPLAALLLVLDWWPLKRLNRSALLEKVPFFAVAGLFAVVAIISQARAAQGGNAQLMHPLYFPLVAAYCFGFYLSKIVYPTALVSDYLNPDPFGLANHQVLASAVAATVVLVAIGLSARRTRAWVGGIAFFLVALLPTMGLVRFTMSLAANRSLYFPMVGLLLPLTWGLGRLWNMSFGVLKVPAVRAVLIGISALLVVGSISVTRRYESHWCGGPGSDANADGTLNLLRYYLTQSPNDWRLHNRLGNEWMERKDSPSAIVEFREAVRLNPTWAGNHLSLGRALFMAGQYSEARRAFAEALTRAPVYGVAHLMMGLTLLREEDLGGALREFRTAAQLDPNRVVARFHAAEILARLGRVDEAMEEYRRILRIEPMNGRARMALQTLVSGN
jgi:protein O-mannosyl-transferase